MATYVQDGNTTVEIDNQGNVKINGELVTSKNKGKIEPRKSQKLIIKKDGVINGDITGNIEITGNNIRLIINGNLVGNITGPTKLEIKGNHIGNTTNLIEP